jgi:response regulator RpfG family c-di-GMP phosphodiesterase
VQQPRILVAGTQHAFELCRRVLGEESELLCAGSLREALGKLDEPIDLVVCSVRFDESRMFEFLHALQTHPTARDIPVICVRTGHAPLSPSTHDAIAAATEALGVQDFLDMHELERRLGEAAADDALRTAVRMRLVTAGPPGGRDARRP